MMRKYNYISNTLFLTLCALLFPLSVFANSSWRWISETRPYDLLPMVIIVTLAAETLAINFIPKVRKLPKVFCFVTLGNLLSFLVPYLIKWKDGYDFAGRTLIESVERWPFYTIGTVFLVMTIIIETPVIYFSLRNNTKNKKALIATIIISNIVTTAFVAIIERTLCYGIW